MGGGVVEKKQQLVVTTAAVSEGEGELNIPFKPFISSIGHGTLSQDDNQADDELNNVDLDIPILPEHLQSSYHGYTGSNDLGGLERVEEHDILGQGLGIWNRAKAIESERYAPQFVHLLFMLCYFIYGTYLLIALGRDLEERREATEHRRRSRRRRRKGHHPRSSSHSRSGPHSSHHPDSHHSESCGTNGVVANDGAPGNDRANGRGNGGLLSAMFECKLPYAFPRAYPEDESDDEVKLCF
jgi:hypothetical protein